MTTDELFDRCLEEFKPDKHCRESRRLDMLYTERDLMCLVSYVEEDDTVVFTASIYSKREIIYQNWMPAEHFLENFKKYLELVD